MNTKTISPRALKTIAIISIVTIALALALASAILVLILTPRPPFSTTPMELPGQITNATFTAGNPNGMISAIFNNTSTTKITIYYVFVNSTVQPTWTCYVDGAATSPVIVQGYEGLGAVVPSNSGAVINITTTVVAGNQYEIMFDTSMGNPFRYLGTAPT